MSRIQERDLVIDGGLAAVSHVGTPEVVLPPPATPLPPERSEVERVERLLARQSIDDYLYETLWPQITDTKVLQPVHFQEQLIGAYHTLLNEARAAPGGAAARAALVLREELKLRQLLDFYRQALLAA